MVMLLVNLTASHEYLPPAAPTFTADQPFLHRHDVCPLEKYYSSRPSGKFVLDIFSIFYIETNIFHESITK